jgi:outer membrane protein assembly factor BamB
LDAESGTLVWQYDTEPGSSFTAGPVIGDGIVYLSVSNTAHTGDLYAVNLDSHTLRWRTLTGGENYASPAVGESLVYAASIDGTIFALEKMTGAERWRYVAPEAVFSSPALAGNTLYFGAWNNNLYALNANNGRELWRFATGGGVSSPAVYDGVVYVGSDDGVLYEVR